MLITANAPDSRAGVSSRKVLVFVLIWRFISEFLFLLVRGKLLSDLDFWPF